MKLGSIIIEVFSTQAKPSENLTTVLNALSIPLIKRINQTTLPDLNTLLPTLHSLTQHLDGIVIGYNDSEFYVLDENRRLVTHFKEYGADIAFGDGYPEGMVFLILRPETLPVMENIRTQHKISVSREVFHNIIETDVNTFDIDNIYPDHSLRTLRLSFFSNNIQNIYTLSQIKKLPQIQTLKQKSNSLYAFNDIAEIILSHKHILKTIPKYYEFTLTNYGAHHHTFSPYHTHHNPNTEKKLQQKETSPQEPPISPQEPPITHLSLKNYSIMLRKARAFSKDPIIALAGCTDPTTHPKWTQFVETTLNHKLNCIIETSALGFSKEIADTLLTHPQKSFLKIIFKLNGTTAAMHAKVTGLPPNLSIETFTPQFEKRLEAIEYYLLRNPAQSYIEITKVRDNIHHLSEFYDHFKRYTPNIIIAKYNSYKGHLQERRDDPMRPFYPIDCWHLKRDFYIDELGDVWVCKQDFHKKHCLGNLITDPIEQLFNNGTPYYQNHLNNWSFCKNCDEAYTYNF
ncbi:hypothetical protein COTS27_01671 [Spirochaetota bacterium]|nr:hypothetical protein COTS27_01671 [Spirochaetota bacterium]